MKKLLLTGLLTLAMGLAAQAVSFTYSSELSSFIVFSGASSFTFSPTANSFKITSGSAIGDLGEITGTFSIGAITTSGGVSTASVSGPGQFVIHAAGGNFTAALTWVNIQQVGTGGTLNTGGTANLSSIVYSGTDVDLLALKAKGNGANALTFTFIPAVSLSDLATTSGHQTAFSGTVATPDGGTTVVLLGFALAGMGTLRRTIKGLRA